MTAWAFDTVLIANRGEIARRVIRTARALGLRTVAVYSEADISAPHVREADEAVLIGPARPADSYLNAPGILSAAKSSGAGAIHPGYGFLSESAAFARQAEEAGITFIGPTPRQLEAFGAKHTARALARAAGVPMTAGTELLSSAAEAVAAARDIGLPVMVKATGGGGGIGMQACFTEAEVAEAFERVSRLAERHFAGRLEGDRPGGLEDPGGVGDAASPREQGDRPALPRTDRSEGGTTERREGGAARPEGGRHGGLGDPGGAGDAVSPRKHGVFLERLVRPARHVEVQVFGDGAGRVAILGDRDCSLQRRHQKVIEEAPAPGLPPSLRRRLHAAARDLAASVAYRSAGTVEFVYDPARREASFLEVNARLQVEHPVTEQVYRVDLVEQMLRLAGLGPDGVAGFVGARHVARGHAVEARVYAEDPNHGSRPSAGLVTHVRLPASPAPAPYAPEGMFGCAIAHPKAPSGAPGDPAEGANGGPRADSSKRYSVRPAGEAGELGAAGAPDGSPGEGADDPADAAVIRVDSWIEAGLEVSAHYDPMLAKVIAQAGTREAALGALGEALRDTRVDGVTTNLGLLRAVLDRADVRAVAHSTSTLDGATDPEPRIEVLEAGALTTIQDWPGRLGYWQVGVPPSGPMDEVSLREANLAVGNREGAPALECTATGPSLKFSHDTVICLAGATSAAVLFGAGLDGTPAPWWEPFTVPAGAVLEVGAIPGPGLRAYLAVRGGLDVPLYLGSASTFTLGRFGGHSGRALRGGDVLYSSGGYTAPSGGYTPTPQAPHLHGVLAVDSGSPAESQETAGAPHGSPEARSSAAHNRPAISPSAVAPGGPPETTGAHHGSPDRSKLRSLPLAPPREPPGVPSPHLHGEPAGGEALLDGNGDVPGDNRGQGHTFPPVGRDGGRAGGGGALTVGGPVPVERRPAIVSDWEIGVTEGPHAAPEFFTRADIETLYAATYIVHHNSARTGVRLIGPRPQWAREDGGEAGLHPSNIHDVPYAVGALDFTGDTPIILGPDGPSLGGFTCPVVVASGELWKTGQLRPGDTVRFVPVREADAAALRGRRASPALRRAGGDGDDGILARRDAGPGTPAVAYRRDGDGSLIVEYGEPVLDLGLRMRVHALQEALEAEGLAGVVDLTPGIRSLQVHADAAAVRGPALRASELVGLLQRIEDQIPATGELRVPSRTVRLPLSWDDPATRLATERYMASVRSDAPWTPWNIEFIRRINGLATPQDVRRIVFGAKYLVLGLGDVYLGAPVATPVDPRHRLVTTKYNPARTWTAENSVGIGGAYLCIYGMEGPGGYQFVGRTIQVWNRFRRAGLFADAPWALRFFDQVEWYPVSAEELLDLRAATEAGRGPAEVSDGWFDYGSHTRFLAANAESIVGFRARQAAAFAAEKERWRAAGEFGGAQSGRGAAEPDLALPDSAGRAVGVPEGATAVTAPFTASVWQVDARPGAPVAKGDKLISLEAMKMETIITAPHEGVVAGVYATAGAQVEPGQVLITLVPAASWKPQ
jgi:acetyl/propionyl-CoA carboxylase alpha subunit/allophanate hydrolase subunit 2